MANYGWTFNADKIAEATARIESSGMKFSFSADRPSMSGYWKRQQYRGVARVAAQDDEFQLTGALRKPNSQSRGTCVGQGSSRAIEDVHNSRLVDGVIVGEYTQIAYEPMYGFERNTRWSKTHPWGCNCGNCPDGLQGADAASFYTNQGVLRRANYSQLNIDLSSPREELAINWNNSGVPQTLIAAAAFHKIQCHSSTTWEEYADPIAAKMWGHVCLPQIFSGTRVEVGGTVLPDGNGGHDTECCGIVKLDNGESAFLIQQSWGDAVHYPPVVQTASGPLTMRPGSYAVRQSVLEGIRGGIELISCDIPSGSSFRAI